MTMHLLNSTLLDIDLKTNSIGGQWSLQRIGEIGSAGFLLLVTSLAAVFCVRWSLFSSVAGRPYSIELQESSLDVTKAWISLSQPAWVRYFLIFSMFLTAKEADLHMLLTWFVSFRWLSVVTPGSMVTPRTTRCWGSLHWS